MSLISVVIPVYNGERTIRKTVNSVLAQTHKDIELIVINDGSQDATAEILAAIDDQRLRVCSYPNAGLSASRNRGLKLARGEFISFLDADDLWTSDKLQDQLNALHACPQAAVAYSGTEFIDETGQPLGFGIQHYQNGFIFPDLLLFFFIGSGSNALFRTYVFDEVGEFDESLRAAEDWDLCLRVAARYQFVAVPKTQILYRVIENSMSGNVLQQERETLKVVNRAYTTEPGSSLQHLRRKTYASVYSYLAGRVLRGAPSRQSGLIAARFLWRSFVNDPSILKQGSLFYVLLFKAITAMTLSPQRAHAARAALKAHWQRLTHS